MIRANKTIAFLAAAALLVALLVAALFWTFGQVSKASDERRDAYAILTSADGLMSALKDAETGERGYVLTGNESFLEPYLAVRDGLNGHLEQLRQLTYNSAARKHLDALAPLIDTKLAEMAQAIELRRNQGAVAAIRFVSAGEGRQLMDSIRAEMGSISSLEADALEQTDAAFRSKMRNLFLLILAASLLALLFAVLFAYLIRRETRHRFDSLFHLETQHLLEAQEATNKILLQTNATLQISEQKLAVTLNSIGDAVIATDAAGRLTLLNPVAEQLTGWTQAEAVGRPVDDIFHVINQETRQPSAIPVKETLAHGTVHGLANHTVLVARDGSECAIADSCAPIRDGDGRVVGAVLIFRDVTEEYAAQQALRDSNALIHTVLDTVADGVITFRADGGVVERVNPAAEHMFGYAAAELIGQPFSLLLPGLGPDQAGGSLAHYGVGEAARAAGLGREVAGRRKDGSIVPLEIAVSEMWQRGTRYFTGILRDIAARKRAEAEQALLDQRLRDQQFYTRSLIEANIDAIMTTDPSGIITDVNRQMEALTGCTRDELIGAAFKHFFTDPARAEAGIKLVLREKSVSNYELTARAVDGKETAVSYNATTFYDRDRQLQGVFAAARDISEREHLYQMLQERNTLLESARAAADKANLAKSDFLSNMSHELRTPLNAVLGFAQVLESGFPLPTPSQKRSLDQILKAGWYLLELINEILDLAKIESGKLTLSREPVSLNQIMLECQAMIEPQAQARGIGMRFPRFDGPSFALADRTRLKQVLINLLFNAIKYNKRNGSVVVDCTAVAPSSVRISVKDTGEGLSPEQMAQLFQPFNRLGKDAGVEEGTGIGLVVAKRLVEVMGGSIGVESTPGVGTVFWIELNLCAAPQLVADSAESGASREPAVNAGGPLRTLLYVEDNPANLQLVEELVKRRSDLRLLSAADGKFGVELAREFLPEVILMDINLPGISGFEVLKILRKDPATAHIPIIAISANAMSGEISKGLEAGFCRYLTKPIVVNEFMDALNVALEFSAARTENKTVKE